MKLLIQDFFTRRPIARQLVFLRNLLIGGFVLLGVIYAAAVGVQTWFLNYNVHITDFRQKALQVQAQMLQARRDEKDFLLRKQTLYLDNHKKTTKALFDLTTETLAAAPDDQSRDLVSQVEAGLRNYNTTFLDVARAESLLGLNEASGLLGSLRNSVHNAEGLINASKDTALLASLLMMRRHEKDFLARVDEQYLQKMKVEKAHFDSLLAKSKAAEKGKIAAKVNEYQKSFFELVDGKLQAQIELEDSRKSVHTVEPLLTKLGDLSAQKLATADKLLTRIMFFVHVGYAAALFIIAALLAGGLFIVSRSISSPLGKIVETINRLAGGDDGARTEIRTRNEFGQLSTAFDTMMDERVATQAAIQRENEQLNESVLKLLQAVAQLSRRDLTIKVPVTEDVTGPVADALNLLTSETGKVLTEVSNISADVTSASMKVKEQADAVHQVAEVSRKEVDETAAALAAASEAMAHIAELAQECNISAENAIKTTQEALKAVTNTVGGINNTRDTIRETEKRIKRLGERSQEISGAVNLINTIAERTHILALNASMHAASAGEAGRGFAVVADEVQRLAENARQATAQIASLVNNIQVETIDTVNTMNQAITQVVEGAKLAEQAGDRMVQTEAKTSELVHLVQRIAADSREQVENSAVLMERADQIRKSSEETSRSIEQATKFSDNLVEYARNLLGAVRVFKLPS